MVRVKGSPDCLLRVLRLPEMSQYLSEQTIPILGIPRPPPTSFRCCFPMTAIIRMTVISRHWHDHQLQPGWCGNGCCWAWGAVWKWWMDQLRGHNPACVQDKEPQKNKRVTCWKACLSLIRLLSTGGHTPLLVAKHQWFFPTTERIMLLACEAARFDAFV